MSTITTMDIKIQKTKQSRFHDVNWKKLGFGNFFADHMFVTEYAEGQWKNSKIVPYGKLEVSPALSALHYGQSIFEGMKAYRHANGEIYLFRPLDNLRRLNVSAERMAMATVPEDLFMEGLTQLIRLDENWVSKEEGCSLYIRPLLFATEEHIGVKISDTYQLIIMNSPVSAYYAQPLKVLVETKYTRAVPGGVGFAKTAGNYARSHYPTKMAQQKGYHQLIWTDGYAHKYFEESGTMNVMCVINNTLITPDLHDTILAGITRDSVITLAKEMGLKVEERKISIDEVVDAFNKKMLTEMFGVGTAATIAPIYLFGYNGKDHELPPITATGVGARIKKQLDDIRTGKVADTHDWMYKI